MQTCHFSSDVRPLDSNKIIIDVYDGNYYNNMALRIALNVWLNWKNSRQNFDPKYAFCTKIHMMKTRHRLKVVPPENATYPTTTTIMSDTRPGDTNVSSMPSDRTAATIPG